MLKTKSILAPKEHSDGIRISVMSRHTLNDGLMPNPEISLENYQVWLKDLAPPEKIVGDYYKRGLSWDKFETKYLEYLRKENIQIRVQKIAKTSLDETITLLCIEDSPEHCHRRLLAEECGRYEPSLILDIK